MIKQYQVVSMDKKGYIIEFNNYQVGTESKLLEYVNFQLESEKVNKIEITRWNTMGERE